MSSFSVKSISKIFEASFNLSTSFEDGNCGDPFLENIEFVKILSLN